MNVTSGTRLGPYEIDARLGAGGMGEVWSARDTRLDRRVAVKILPAELARDAQFRLRFEREARTISQLTHPHICTLYDVGEGFLVMELLDGETLADRVERGPLPMSEVLKYGLQIAEALGKAHRMGIVHRDLKPGNIMITKSGAKLLDFGLAKSSVPIVDLDGATYQKPLTQEGTILGTFQYMAPEQLEGLEADARTDIFALGAVLYEMSTGRRAFDGKTKTSLIAQIVSADPKPLRDLQPLTPPAFEHVVARCLSKDPDERWQSATDIAEELRWAASGAGSLPEQRTRRAGILPWAIAATVLVAAVAAIAFLLNGRPVQRVVWLDIASPSGVRMVSPSDRGGSAIAPDGNQVAFVGQNEKDSVGRIYVRDLASGDVRAVASTEGASFPFWSPDSKSIAFFADGKLKRAEVGGARAMVIAGDVDGRGGSWSQDGTIVFAPTSTSGLVRVRATGGKPEPVAEMTGDQNSLRFPSFLPDGKHFLYLAQGNRDGGIHLGSTAGGVSRRLLDAKDSAIYAADSILFMRDGVLYAQNFDARKLVVQGEPRQIASGVSSHQSAFASADLSASAAGDLLFPSEFAEKASLVWRDRAGALLLSLPLERMLNEPVFSPDQKRVVAGSNDDSLWDVDLERGRTRRLTSAPLFAGAAVWAPDGKRIFFTSTSNGKSAVASMLASGTNVEILATAARPVYTDAISSDGAVVVLDGPGPSGKDFDLWTLTLSDRKIRPLVSSTANQTRGQFSPDGRFISYSSDETGRPEIFVQTFPPSENKWQITINGGDQAFWRGDGKELFYLALDGKVMSVTMQLDPSVTFADPTVLFQTPLTLVSMTGRRNQYLVTRDGQRFLLVESASTAPTHLKLVLNFPQLLAKEQ